MLAELRMCKNYETISVYSLFYFTYLFIFFFCVSCAPAADIPAQVLGQCEAIFANQQASQLAKSTAVHIDICTMYV